MQPLVPPRTRPARPRPATPPARPGGRTWGRRAGQSWLVGLAYVLQRPGTQSSQSAALHVQPRPAPTSKACQPLHLPAHLSMVGPALPVKPSTFCCKGMGRDARRAASVALPTSTCTDEAQLEITSGCLTCSSGSKSSKKSAGNTSSSSSTCDAQARDGWRRAADAEPSPEMAAARDGYRWLCKRLPHPPACAQASGAARPG